MYEGRGIAITVVRKNKHIRLIFSIYISKVLVVPGLFLIKLVTECKISNRIY